MALLISLLFASAHGLHVTTINQSPSFCDSKPHYKLDFNKLNRFIGDRANASQGLTAKPEVWIEVSAGVRKQTKFGISSSESEVIAKAITWQVNNGVKQLRTVEAGLANGASAISFVGAAIGTGTKSHHTAFDPFQEQDYNNQGKNKTVALLSRYNQSHVRFDAQGIPVAVGLGNMLMNKDCVDVALMDDGHLYDDNMAEAYFFNKLLRPGAILILDDAKMGSVHGTVDFMLKNLPFRLLNVHTGRFAALVKTGPDTRNWTHFVPFDSSGR